MAYNEVRGFVYRVVDIFPGPLKTPARWVADRIFGVWDDISQVLAQVRPAWLFFHDHFWWLLAGIHSMAENAARTIRWLAVEAIPTWSKWARDVAVSVTAYAVNALKDWSIKAIAFWRDFLVGSINAVKDFATSLLRWATDRFHEVWNTLNAVRNRVVALLTSPETLVDWLFSALWRRFWRFTNDHAEAIASYGWARRDAIIAQTMHRLESWLVRML